LRQKIVANRAFHDRKLSHKQ